MTQVSQAGLLPNQPCEDRITPPEQIRSGGVRAQRQWMKLKPLITISGLTFTLSFLTHHGTPKGRRVVPFMADLWSPYPSSTQNRPDNRSCYPSHKQKIYLQVCASRRRTFIHTCRSYVHTPHELDRHVSHKSLEASHNNKGALANSSDIELLGEQSSPKWEIPCPERRCATVQNLTPLALSSVDKSITVQTNNKKTDTQTVNDISTPCLSAHVDNKLLVVPSNVHLPGEPASSHKVK